LESKGLSLIDSKLIMNRNSRVGLQQSL